MLKPFSFKFLLKPSPLKKCFSTKLKTSPTALNSNKNFPKSQNENNLSSIENTKPIERYEAPAEKSLEQMLKMRSNVRPPPSSFADFYRRFRAEAYLTIFVALWITAIIALWSTKREMAEQHRVWAQRLARLKIDGDRLRVLQLSERKAVLCVLRNCDNKELIGEAELSIKKVYEETDNVLREFDEIGKSVFDEKERALEVLKKTEERILKKK